MEAEAGNLESLVLAGERVEPGKSHPEYENLKSCFLNFFCYLIEYFEIRMLFFAFFYIF